MALHSNLQRRKTGYYFRQMVPKHLIAVIGKSEIVRSLHTHNPFIAKERCRLVALEISASFDNLVYPSENIGFVTGKTNNPMPASEQQATHTMTLDDLLERWAIERNLITPEQRIQNSYYKEVERMVARCNDVLGLVAINRISSDDVRQVKAVYFEDHRAERMQTGTIKKYMDSLKMLIDFATNNNWLPPNHIASGAYHVRVNDDEETERCFPPEELNRLFHSPYFTGYHLPTKKHVAGDRITKDHFYWIPLIGLCTGMRVEEIAQLSVDDIMRDDGIDYFNITDAKPYQKLKNATSKRKIPIHYELINCGFLKYVASIRNKAHDQLFPELIPNRENKLSKKFSRDFGRYIRRIDISDHRVVFHSFRHRFKDACRNAGMMDSIHDRLTGHSAPNVVAASYGSGFSISVLKRAIDSISLEVDLSHLYDCDGEPVHPSVETQLEEPTPTPKTPEWIPLSRAYALFGQAVFGKGFSWDEVKLMAQDNYTIPRGRMLYIDSHKPYLLTNHPLFQEGEPDCQLIEAPKEAAEQAERLRIEFLKGIGNRFAYQLTDEEGDIASEVVKWLQRSDKTKVYFSSSMVQTTHEDGSSATYIVHVDANGLKEWINKMRYGLQNAS